MKRFKNILLIFDEGVRGEAALARGHAGEGKPGSIDRRRGDWGNAP